MSLLPSVTKGQIKTADGSSIVKLGKCSTVCGIVLKAYKGKGTITLNCDFPSSCSPKYTNHPNPESQELSYILNKHINSLIDPSALQIDSELGWNCVVDVVCLSDSDRVADCAWIAVLSAFKDLKLPSVYLEDETVYYKEPYSALEFKVSLFFTFPDLRVLLDTDSIQYLECTKRDSLSEKIVEARSQYPLIVERINA